VDPVADNDHPGCDGKSDRGVNVATMKVFSPKN
jgi:hypothetical protein